MSNRYLEKIASLVKEADDQNQGLSTGAKVGLGLAAAGGLAGGAYLLRKGLASRAAKKATGTGMVHVGPSYPGLKPKGTKQRGYAEVKANPKPHNPQTFDHTP